MSRSVPTVGGQVDSAQLGRTLMHEHIFIRTPELQEAWPGFMGFEDEDAVVADAHEKLKAIKASGIDTLVDMTAPGLGRQVKRVARAVEGTGLNVIVVTGYYTYTDLPFPMKYNGPGRFFNTDPDDAFLVDLFVRDIEEGIEGTGIKAGVVKCCTDEPGVTPDIERLIRAVAKTHLRTDVPIMTHTHAKSRRGLDQQRILAEEGVDLTRVLIGHSNETSDVDYLVEMMDAGSYLGFDRCGLMVDHPLADQQETLVELCKRGYAGQIVLSQDRHCYSDWFPEDGVLSFLPDWHHGFVQQSLIPGLLQNGVTQDQVDQMMMKNPVAFFSASRDGGGVEASAPAAAAEGHSPTAA
jgi:phosphotriesterase-related protein